MLRLNAMILSCRVAVCRPNGRLLNVLKNRTSLRFGVVLRRGHLFIIVVRVLARWLMLSKKCVLNKCRKFLLRKVNDHADGVGYYA